MNTFVKIVCVWFLVDICNSENVSSIKSLIIVHRHGDRTPIHLYPKDPYRDDKFWPDGLGQLTIAGKRRMFKLGQFLRRRYSNFLTNNPRELNVRSAESDRCLQSCQLVASGAYPPEGRWVWNQNTNWQPFAIRTKPEKYDGMLSVDAECPTAKREKKNVEKSPEFLKYTEIYKKFFEYLSLNTGDNITNVFNAEYLHSTLLIEKEFGFELPNWVNDRVISELENIASLAFYFGYNTKTLQRLRAGLMLKEIRKIFKDATRKQSKLLHSNPPKLFHILSTHDTSVAALLNALGVYNYKPPPFGATVIFELHSTNRSNLNGTNIHIIKAFYLNVTESVNPIVLRLPACDRQENCPLKTFIQNVEELIPDNWRHECGLEIRNQSLAKYMNYSESDEEIDNNVNIELVNF